MKRAFLAGLLAAAVASSTGCCHIGREFVYGPFGPGTSCDTTHCGQGDCGCQPFGPAAVCGIDRGYGPACEAPCGDSCGAPSGPCDAGGPGPCGACNSCGPNGNCRGPLTFVLGLLHPATWGCGSGCGEVYYGDFNGDPPDLCDPCDRMGGWTGGDCSTGGCSTGGYSTGGSSTGSCPTCGTTRVTTQPRVVSESESVVSPASQVPTKAASAKTAPTKRVPTKAVPTMPAKPQPVSPEAARPLRGPTRR
jgi:hypothetical protein